MNDLEATAIDALVIIPAFIVPTHDSIEIGYDVLKDPDFASIPQFTVSSE